MKKAGLKEPKARRLAKLFSYRAFPRNNSPKLVAWSVFWGVWIGVMPTIGIAIPLTLLFCWIFNLPKAPAAAASFVSNPFTVPPFYILAYSIGKQILTPPPVSFNVVDIFLNSNVDEFFAKIEMLMSESPPHLYSFLVGICIVSTVVSFIFWLIAYEVVKYRRKKQNRPINM